MTAAGEPAVIGDQLHYVGVDAGGVELEIVAVPDDRNPGGLAVVHAMPTSSAGRRAIMIDPTEYVVNEDDVISDVDLDTEILRLQDGRRLTNELAEQLARRGDAG